MDAVRTRIDEWERSGLIDGPTAGRLRDSVATSTEGPATDVGPAAPASPGPAPAPEPAPPRPGPSSTSFSAVFGPGVTIGEMFSYLGVGFIVGAWSAFVIRVAGERADVTVLGGGALVTAIGLIVLGIVLGLGDARRRRGAGIALLFALGYVEVGVAALATQQHLDPLVLAMVVTAVGVAAALAFSMMRPGLVTTLGLVLTITSFGWSILAYLESLLVREVDFGMPRPDQLLPIVVAAGGWLLIALVLGLIALSEDRSAPDGVAEPSSRAAARRRSALIRGWAGLVAIYGLASTVTQSSYDGETFGRVIPAWIGDGTILILAAILVERAFRRDSAAFLVAAGIGLIVALSDFNFTYLSEARDLGLLIEGGILLAAGFAADRLRRRLPGGRPPSGPESIEASPSPAG